jgi:hypothetical protein
MRTTSITALRMRKTSITNGSAYAHNLYYSSAHAQDFFTNGSAHAHNFYTALCMRKTSVPKLKYLPAKYRHILTPKSKTVRDYIPHTADKTITLLALPPLFCWSTLQLYECVNSFTYDKQSEMNVNVHKATGEEKNATSLKC